MKHIQKRSEPAELTTWKHRYRKWKNKDQVWNKFQKKTEVRDLVKNSLLEEQFYLCCYCEQSLEGEYGEIEAPLETEEEIENSPEAEEEVEVYGDAQPNDSSNTTGEGKPEKSHIEHFQPRKDSAVDPLNYDNLLCSCLKDWPPSVPLHCGALKANWFDPSLLISPLDPTCESRFAYSALGDIIPADKDDLAAATTIEKLGLNIPKLREMRAEAVAPFGDESLSSEELQILVDDYLQDKNGKLNRFWTTIKSLYA